jgi:hypothetical protein
MTEYPTPNPDVGIDLGQKAASPVASAAPRGLFYFIMT